MPFSLIENAGQWDAPASFVGSYNGVQVDLLPGAIQFQLHQPGQAQGVTVRLSLEGGQMDCKPRGESRRPERTNFYLGSDSSRWKTDVRSYSSAIYEDLLPGVDLRLREGEARFEWDLLVDTQVDVQDIVMVCDGAQGLSLAENGDLLVGTELGPIRMSLPVSWSVNPDGSKEPVASAYRQIDDTRFAFSIEDRPDLLPLVIDPGIEWATYLGGTDLDVATAVRVAANGEVFVAGLSRSLSFQSAPHAAGTFDSYIAVFSPNGSSLRRILYLGGDADDACINMDFDPAGDVVLAGGTDSPNFPITAGALQSTKGASWDGCIATFDASNLVLQHSTFLGDASTDGADWITDVDVDANGDWNVCGLTRSPSFPTTAGSFGPSYGGGLSDAFACRIQLSAGSSSLVWSGFLGGDGREGLNANLPPGRLAMVYTELSVDADGSVVVLGNTESNNYPTTAGCYQAPPVQNVRRDAFISRIGASGAMLVNSTLLGGTSWEGARGLALDEQGNVVVSGYTFSIDFPIAGGFQATNMLGPVGEEADGFVAVLTNDLSSLLYSTFVGGIGFDEVSSVKVDASGRIVGVGRTGSTDFPTTPWCLQPNLNGSSDGFALRIDRQLSALTQLRYSTLLGGGSFDSAGNLELLSPTRVLIVGSTDSSDFPVTAGAANTTYSGGEDATLVQLEMIPHFESCGNSSIPCPCGNGPVEGQGCTNSSNVGASLEPSGSGSVSADDMVMDAHGLLPGKPAMLFGGTAGLSSSGPLILGDGLRFAGGFITRLQVQLPDPGGTSTWSNIASYAGWTPGAPRYLQVWYRDIQSSPCGSAFNLSACIKVNLCP